MKILALVMICAAVLAISEGHLARRRAAVRATEREERLIGTVWRGIRQQRGDLARVLCTDCADILNVPELYSLFLDTDGCLREDTEKRIAAADEALLPNKTLVCDIFHKIRKGDDVGSACDELSARLSLATTEYQRRERICRTLSASAIASLVLLFI